MTLSAPSTPSVPRPATAALKGLYPQLHLALEDCPQPLRTPIWDAVRRGQPLSQAQALAMGEAIYEAARLRLLLRSGLLEADRQTALNKLDDLPLSSCFCPELARNSKPCRVRSLR